MGYPILLHPLVRTSDVPTVGVEEGPSDEERLELRRELVRLLARIEGEPRVGRPMRYRRGYEILADCHSLPFDLADWKGKDRFRIVYKIDPSIEAVDRVLVYAVGPRGPGLEVYRRARKRRQQSDWP